MDRKEAVTILQEKRDLARMLEAAEKSADWAAKDRVDSSSLRASQHGRYADALDMAISALSPPNEPLTQADLDSMDYDKVWIDYEDGTGEWALVCNGYFHNLTESKRSPLVEAGWTEEDCRHWCEENDLLSPIYTTATRGGCWFCHNQGVGQLRLLRKNYPEFWALMLKWDKDSPVTFHADGHTVHDFDRRFAAEDEGLIYPDDKVFRWSMLDDELNYRWF